MKILFLDIDGVLNSKQHFLAIKDVKVDENASELMIMKQDVNPNNMWVLRYILKIVPDLRVVISSAWRLHYRLDQLKELFKVFNLNGNKIIDITPKLFGSIRGEEIQAWLSNNQDADWVVVDDHQVFSDGSSEKAREILTDPWIGLTMYDAFKIIRHFKSSFCEPIISI